ncbi:MAG: C1 family peptidase [Muribaculaceae bacterium]|nr:C1 family peptidase [Muribaculaceae bacterium]
MKRIILPLLALVPVFGFATYMEAPATADDGVVNPDSTGFKFTDIKILPTTPVKDQNKSGTCWSFAGTSSLEEEVLRQGGPELDLSEMFTVRQAYIDKAKKYIRMGGCMNFAQGGGFADVLAVLGEQGVVPEDVYSGLNYGEEKHMHYEMASALKGYLDGILKNENKRLSTAWLPGYIGILDAYLGKVPETFTYNGKTYTPKEFAKAMGLDAKKFKSYTSYTHHPFYEEFALEIPDNWRSANSVNVPMEDLKAIVDNALENGYTICWAADVSEPTFKWREGYAVLPAKRTEADMDGTELARWVKLSDSDRKKSESDIKGPVKERVITQEDRQKTFDNMETTDDHGMVIVGYATDQEGNRYYKVKNSWDTNQIYDGYIYVSEPYFLEKTIAVMAHDGAVPSDIAKKIKK